MTQSTQVIFSEIGNRSSMPDFPTNDIPGLLEALKRWPLDNSLGPFKSKAWGIACSNMTPQSRSAY